MMFRTALRAVTALMLADLGRFHEVFNARAPVITREHLPCVKIWTPDDDTENLSIGNPELRGTLTFNVQVVIEGTEDEANALLIDALCESVMHLLLESGEWLQLFDRVLSLATTTESNTEGEMRTVTATMAFQIQYAEILTTRVVDYLDKLRIVLVLPSQPELPDGEIGETVETEIELPRV